MPNLAFAGSPAFADDDTIEGPRIVSRDNEEQRWRF